MNERFDLKRMEELLMNVRAYSNNELGISIDFKYDPSEDWWVVSGDDGDDCVYGPMKIKEAGEFNGVVMVEVVLSRYNTKCTEYVQASDHVIARLLYC